MIVLHCLFLLFSFLATNLFVASVVFLRVINVGGANRCRPAAIARQLARFDVVNIGAVGTFVGPSTPGSAYSKAHHLAARVDEHIGCFGYIRGGMGALSEAIDTGTDKRYVRRNQSGRFKESDDVGRSLAQDRERKARRRASLVKVTKATDDAIVDAIARRAFVTADAAGTSAIRRPRVAA